MFPPLKPIAIKERNSIAFLRYGELDVIDGAFVLVDKEVKGQVLQSRGQGPGLVIMYFLFFLYRPYIYPVAGVRDVTAGMPSIAKG